MTVLLRQRESGYNMMLDLERFIKAQDTDYETALNEIKAGRKKSHWIWYIFPQLQELGRSYNAKYYGIENLDEAKNYLAHSVLGRRLIEISGALLNLSENNPNVVMNGEIDAMKLQSCMMLFAYACGEKDSVFHKVLEKFFNGETDGNTTKIISK